MTRREEALAALDGLCPRCGARREPTQEYCVECGLRLPPVRGTVPALRRRWLRRLGWYPGDWVWVSLLMLLVAVGGAAAAIALGSDSTSDAATTSVAPSPHEIAPASTARRGGGTATQPAAPNGRTAWPAGRDGWTIVLFSYPVPTGTTAAYATASRAAQSGLPEVGVLESAGFASLHPGYYVVFTGVYSSASEADAALRSVRAAGFSNAYARQISR